MRARVTPVITIVAACAVLSCVVSGCGGLVDPSKNQLETVSGQLTSGAVSINGPYNISKSGEYTITFTNMQPPLPVNFYVEVAFGLYASGTCQPIQGAVNQAAIVGHEVLGTSITPGAYCLAVVDEGYLTGGVTYTYTLQFSHP